MIVMKFGGTSVQDAKAIERAAAIVKGAPGAKAGGRGQRHGQSDRPVAGHGPRRRRRRSQDRAETLPRRCRSATTTPPANCWARRSSPSFTATWKPTSRLWTNCCAASRPSAN